MKFDVYLIRYWSSFSYIGLIVGSVFFAASLSPSLVPRNILIQGILSGSALTLGYALGVFASYVGQFLGLPEPSHRIRRIADPMLLIGTLTFVSIFLWRATIWQNSIRSLMEMELVDSSHPWGVGLIAGGVSIFLVACGRLLWWFRELVAAWLLRVVPRRGSTLLSVVIVGGLVVTVVNGLLVRTALQMADAAFAELDAVVDEGIAQPSSPLASGSTTSLIEWDTIGRRGKTFITGGPTKEELSRFSGREVVRPIRVYVGVRTKETLEDRAKLALAELKRIGAFDRSVLVVATPTGTGWLDPAAVDTLEYIHAGDTAIVSIQYSYLPSWLTLLVNPELSRGAASALFNEIYGYWKKLPKETRPKLYLHGLSLGALGSEASTQLFLILENLIQGAVWSGPPFPSTLWSAITKSREPESPAWLPRVADGSMIRFTAQENALSVPGATWGPVRVVYIQHASDPMTFFSPSLLFRRPDWLDGKRGPDVSPYFDWYPIISFLQVAFDLPLATSVPLGYGHNFAPSSYVDAWVAVTQPKEWPDEDTSRLKRHFAK